MAEMLLVNPRRRKRRSGGRKRGRRSLSPAQIAAGFGGGRKRRRRRHRTAALAGPRVARRSRRVGRRRGRRRGGASFRRRASVSMRGFNFNSFLQNSLIPSAVGAAGAIGVDIVLGYLGPNLPAALQTGIAVPLTRIAGAVGLGMAAATVTGKRAIGEQVMAGAITVVLYNYAKNMVKAQFPSLPLSGMGEYVSGFGYAGPALAYPDMSRGMGMYVANQPRMSPATAAVIAASQRVARPRGMAGLVNDEYIEGGYSYA